jgi:nucleotide-binding universal stress UspA family protein
MDTIVFLTDFSVPARHAFDQLQILVKQTDIKSVIIYHSLGYLNGGLYYVGEFIPPPALIDEAYIADVDEKLLLLKQELLNGSPSLRIDTRHDSRMVLDGIQHIAKDRQIDLIIVGMRGNDDNGKNSIGSITNELIQAHKYNLLLVPDMDKTHVFKHALLAVDLSHLNERLPVKTIFHLQEMLSLKWFIVNVSVEGQYKAADLIEEQTFLHSSLDSLEPTYSYLDGEDFIEKLNVYIQEQDIDVLITVPRKLGFFATFFQKSASKKLAVNTKVPILMLVS